LTSRVSTEECWIVTGGAGFIGSNFVHRVRRENRARVVTLDLLTYAGNLENLRALEQDPEHTFVRGDIRDRKTVAKLFADYRPTGLFHFAAESHVDRSIESPGEFIDTNVTGTFILLDETLRYLRESGKGRDFRFLHVSTDEVYGSLSPSDPPFTETTPYAPNSPYAASKAASDHLVRAYHHTYDLPVVTTNCSNNYGPYQFPEKLIPTVILSALEGRPIPLYGDGGNIRDWIYVGDHCEGILAAFSKGRSGETYAIGASEPRTNREIVETITGILDHLVPAASGLSYRTLVKTVPDRPGHDRRYEIDSRKVRTELGWVPAHTFDSGLLETVRWYLEHRPWWTALRARYDGSRQGAGRQADKPRGEGQ
jgi:dTDP-glucose 4,6-dehydratase